uniref:Uncharacterized protein n=1 Tax=Mantoniella antarctica TaxID=81844 RepID=A0A7S0SCX3_9CHLO|mmetsp:Transcript_19417/g.48066  ORF Transcript_19417/g.48066 Transcript_19417/m.48066 type:complete len:269 (+) Transcript_19417:170-976(+)
MVRRDNTNMPPARYLALPGTTETSTLPPLGPKHGEFVLRKTDRGPSVAANTASRAIHRASQKGYTAGRIPTSAEAAKTPATVRAWCDAVRGADQLMSAGSCSGFLGGNRSWRSYLDQPNSALPAVPARPPRQWTSQYTRDYSPTRTGSSVATRGPIKETPARTRRTVGYSKWADAGKDFNESFDKITTVRGRTANDPLMRPFMMDMGGRVRAPGDGGLHGTVPPPGTIRYAGKDTAESQAWDGTMAFDSVYCDKYAMKDTASNVVLAG